MKYYNNNTLVDTADAVIEDGYWTYTIPETMTQTTDDYIRVAQHVGTVYSQYILGNMEFEEPTLEEPTITMPNIGASYFGGTCTEPNTDVYVTLDRDGDLIIDDERAASDGQSWLMVMPGSELIENGDVIEAYHLKANGEYSDEATLTVTGSVINAPLLFGTMVDNDEIGAYSSYALDDENDVHLYLKINNGEQTELPYDGGGWFVYTAEQSLELNDTVEYWQVVNGTPSLHVAITVMYGAPTLESGYTHAQITLTSEYKTASNTVIVHLMQNDSSEYIAEADENGQAIVNGTFNDGDFVTFWQTVDGVRSATWMETLLFIG